MAEPNKILAKMLDRLLAGLVNGPSLNCRPHASRQRLDLAQLARLGDGKADDVFRGLLGGKRATVRARVPQPREPDRDSASGRPLRFAQSIEAADENGIALADAPILDEPPADTPTPQRAWLEQAAVLNKLHTIAEDARSYEQDTGVSVLNIGFPLLNLPPGTFGAGSSQATRRVLAPLAFIPVSVTVKRGAAPAIELACRGDGVDRVIPNTALFAWIEQQTGKSPAEHDEDESGTHPWQEICAIVRAVCATLDLTAPEIFNEPPEAADDAALGEPTVKLTDPPRQDAVPAAPLFPVPAPGDEGQARRFGDDGGVAASSHEDISHLHAAPRAMAPEAAEHVDNHGGLNGGNPVGHASRASAVDPAPDAARISPSAKRRSTLADLQLAPSPKPDEFLTGPSIACAAVLGLFPMANQGLLRDTQAMLADGNLAGPVESFIRQGVSLDHPGDGRRRRCSDHFRAVH